MFDLVYTDASHKDIGVIQAYRLDAAWGEDENDFEIVLPSSSNIDFGALVYVDGTQLGGVVDDKSPDGTGDVATVTYHGRTWHGIMAYSVIQPDAGKDYYTYSGDANSVIRAIITRQGLGDIFECVGNSGITVSGRFDRYTDMYGGLLKMLIRDSNKRGKLSIEKQPGGKVRIQAVEVASYTSEYDSDKYGFKSVLDNRPVNHLVCLGEGDLKDRDVVHFFADQNGSVSQTQTLFGIDERAITYDANNSDHDELVKSGREKLEELQGSSSIDIVLTDDLGTFDIGDIVGALDNLTGIYVESTVAKVIVNVDESGIATYSYEVGEIRTSTSTSGGGVSMSTLEAGYVKKSGDTMSGNLTIQKDSPSENVGATFINDAIDSGTSPSSTRYCGTICRDKGGKTIGYSQAGIKSSGGAVMSLVVTNESQSGKSYANCDRNGLWLNVSKDGTRTVEVSDNVPWLSMLGLKAQGSVIRAYGTASTAADELALTSEYVNPLAGKCAANRYAGIDGSHAATLNTSTGKITVSEPGNYLIVAQVYWYRSFTAGDALETRIIVNGSAVAGGYSSIHARAAGTYDFDKVQTALNLVAGSTVEIGVKNTTAARGTVQRYNTTNLLVIKL